ncbi:DUF6705 family protein [Flavobacterium sp. U410]
MAMDQYFLEMFLSQMRKKIFFTILTIFTIISCKAQTVALNTYYEDVNIGAYFKDLDNEMDKYVGTWQYTHGTDTLTIVLQKNIHVFDGEYYEDLLVGEYRFVNNNQEIVNTLPRFSDFSILGRKHLISGRRQIANNIYLVCNDCNSNEKRFMLNFHDPERNYLSLSLVLRYLPQSFGTPERMTATFIDNDSVMLPDENSPTVPRVPYGEYLMVKQ